MEIGDVWMVVNASRAKITNATATCDLPLTILLLCIVPLTRWLSPEFSLAHPNPRRPKSVESSNMDKAGFACVCTIAPEK